MLPVLLWGLTLYNCILLVPIREKPLKGGPFSNAQKGIHNLHFSPRESEVNQVQPCQVQPSFIPCMLRRLNRAEAAAPPASESAGFSEERQWHPVFRPRACQWSFCIPKEPRTPRTWLPVFHACPTAPAPDQRSRTLCLNCELSLPPLSPFDDSLGADSLTLWVPRVEDRAAPYMQKLTRDIWKNLMINMYFKLSAVSWSYIKCFVFFVSGWCQLTQLHL